MGNNKVPHKIAKHQLQIGKMSGAYSSRHRYKSNTTQGVTNHAKCHQIPGRLFVPDKIGVGCAVSGGQPANTQQSCKIQEDKKQYGKRTQHSLQNFKFKSFE